MKKKLSLKELEVESFVTSLETNEKETVNGQADLTIGPICTFIYGVTAASLLFGGCPTNQGGMICNTDIPNYTNTEGDTVPDKLVNSNHPRWCP